MKPTKTTTTTTHDCCDQRQVWGRAVPYKYRARVLAPISFLFQFLLCSDVVLWTWGWTLMQAECPDSRITRKKQFVERGAPKDMAGMMIMNMTYAHNSELTTVK